MPLYEYQCSKCLCVVSFSIGINDKAPARHGRCGGKLQQVISAPTVIYKGAGWARKV